MKDLTIVGAGLAGLALANALQSAGIQVALHEAHTLPRHRVCGEFICGQGAAALDKLGLSECLEAAKSHRTIQWYNNNKCILRSKLPTPAVGISRYSIDQSLADTFASAGGRLIQNSRFAHGAPKEAIVWCAGRRSEKSDWIGLKCHSTNLKLKADLELHLGEHAYIGLSAVEDGRVNICGLFKRRPQISAPKDQILFHYLKASKLGKLSEMIQASHLDSESHVGVAGIIFAQDPSTMPGELNLGDAYSVIPPFTGNGMSIALESAAIAYPYLLDYSKNKQSWEQAVSYIHKNLHTTFHRRIRIAQAIHPWLHHPNKTKITTALARLRLIPFQTLYKLTH